MRIEFSEYAEKTQQRSSTPADARCVAPFFAESPKRSIRWCAILFFVACVGSVVAATSCPFPDISPQAENALPSRVTADGAYVMFSAGVDASRIDYRFDPAKGLASLEGRVGDGAWIALGRGFQMAVVGVGPVWTLKTSQARSNAWVGQYRHAQVGVVMSIKIDLSGGSLRVWLKSDRGVPMNIDSPTFDGATDLDIPYLRGYEGSIKYLPKEKLFFSYLVDWTKTASAVPVPRISYQPNLAGKTPAVEDLVAITLSRDIDAVLPSIANPVSPYRQAIAESLVAEFWYGNFDRINETLDTYHAYGMDKVIAIIHRWQRYGFDTKLPDIFPPDPQRGGLETMRDLIRRATEHGQKVALHENYVDVYPSAPSWNEKNLMRTSGGQFQEAWADSKHCSPSRMLDSANKVMPVIAEQLKPTAAFLDVHSAQAPWFRTDFRADVPHSAEMKGTRLFTNQLWEYARQTYRGPVFGEGAYHWVHAGCIDSAMAQGSDKERFFPDFVLTKIQPLAINHGMGYYERWCIGYEPKDWMIQVPNPTQMDDYRVAEIAYGHAANIGHQANRIIELVAREYYQVRPLVAKLAQAKVTAIAYHDGKNWLTSSEAILRKADDVRRVKITYDNGIVVCVNRSATPWTVDATTTIAAAGFVAQGPKMLAFSNDAGGFWRDYYSDGDIYYLDPRNSDWNLDPLGQSWAKESIRVNDGAKRVSQGPIDTDTAIALVRDGNDWRLRFFPQQRAGTVTLKLSQLDAKIAHAEALDRDGRPLAKGNDTVSISDDTVTIRHIDGNVWSYRLTR